MKGKWEEGDPFNRLVEIAFSAEQDGDSHAAQDKLLSSLYGWEDEIAQVRHTKELLAASQRAKEKLPMLKQAFLTGLAPGEYIEVKAPFATPDGGQEWMWVEIIAWREEKITGMLKNEPYNIPSLHGGQSVVVNQQDIFDYLWRHADGRQDGNETGAIIMKMQQVRGER